MCTVQHVETKCVFAFQPLKRLVLKRVQKQFRMILEMSFVLANFFSRERKRRGEGEREREKERERVANPLTIIYQLRDPFMVLESVESACLFTKFFSRYRSTQRRPKQTKHPFLLKKRCICYPTNNWSLMYHFDQTNLERKNCVWTAKYKRLLEMCTVQHVETKCVFAFQAIKCLVSTTVKNAKPAETF